MRRVQTLLCLPASDRRLLIGATVLLAAFRIALVMLPFPTVRRLASSAARPAPGPGPPHAATVDRIVWAVVTASRRVPRATCLTEALAAQVLLGRHGHAAHLRLGVARGAAGQFEAHAWLECGGRIPIGGSARTRYVALPAFDGDGP